MRTQVKPPVVVIVGKRATGKTTLIKHLISARNVSDYHVIDALSTENGGTYPEASRVYDVCSGATIKQIVDARKNECFLKNLQNVNEQYVITDNLVLSFNDIMSTDFSEMMMNTNSLKLGAILAMTFHVSMPNPVLWHIDYVFVFKDYNKSDVMRVYNAYMSRVTTFDEFIDIFTAVTTQSPHTCLVIDCTKLAQGNLHHILYSYKVDIGV